MKFQETYLVAFLGTNRLMQLWQPENVVKITQVFLQWIKPLSLLTTAIEIRRPGCKFNVSLSVLSFCGYTFLVQDQTLPLPGGSHLYLGLMTFHKLVIVSTMYLMKWPRTDPKNSWSWVKCLMVQTGGKPLHYLYIWMMFLREWKSWTLPCLLCWTPHCQQNL